ncbi:MAG: hypothetical protein DRJ65_21835 [Acidobacteria bacterium]|nr:MAG: hypothetical protein DRJ65_21835 [Acidobacteriota bacterium]
MLEKIEELLKSVETAGPVPEQRVLAAEKALGVRFPRAYRDFLLFHGSAMGFGWEIYGIDPSRTSEDEPPQYVDVVKTTLRARRASRGDHPAQFIEIAHDGMELGFYLDLSSVEGDDCPVVGQGPGVDFLPVSASFVDFLIAWARDRLEGFP